MSNTIEKLSDLKNCLGVAVIAAGNQDIYADEGELACLLRLIYSSLDECIQNLE